MYGRIYLPSGVVISEMWMTFRYCRYVFMYQMLVLFVVVRGLYSLLSCSSYVVVGDGKIMGDELIF